MSAKSPPWSTEDNDVVIDAYMEMLGLQARGVGDFNKAEFNRRVRRQITRERTHGSVEFKFCNISAVLDTGGLPWVIGYAPRPNAQGVLRDLVFARLRNQDAVLEPTASYCADPTGLLRTVSPPRVRNAGQDDSYEKLVREWDRTEWGRSGRYQRNRELGEGGEELVFEDERRRLRDIGRDDLAKRVKWISKEDDRAGYDILSFTGTDKRRRLLEVKTTRRGSRSSFFITRNELEVSNERSSEWRLVRLFSYGTPRLGKFELAPPLEKVSNLCCTTWRASF